MMIMAIAPRDSVCSEKLVNEIFIALQLLWLSLAINLAEHYIKLFWGLSGKCAQSARFTTSSGGAKENITICLKSFSSAKIWV